VESTYVRHHLRRRHDDGLHVAVRVDPRRGQPVADPQVVGAAAEGHRHLALGRQRAAQRRGVQPRAEQAVLLGDRDRLAVGVQLRQDRHRHRLAVLHHLPGVDQVGHRREDVRPVDAAALAAEHQVVTHGAPARLLGDLDLGHAVLRE
jgi:hypothetical protein